MLVNLQVTPVLYDSFHVPSSTATCEIGQAQIGTRWSHTMAAMRCLIPPLPSICRAPSSPDVGGKGRMQLHWILRASEADLGGQHVDIRKTAQAAAAPIIRPTSFFESVESIVSQHLPANTSVQCDFHCVSEYGEDSLGQRVTFKTKQGIPTQPHPPNVTANGALGIITWQSPQFPACIITAYTSFGMW